MTDIPNLLHRRLGAFSIDESLIRKHPEAALTILRDVLVVRAEMHYGGRIEYEGLSEHFAICDEGLRPPRYRAVLHTDGFGVVFKGWEDAP